MSTQVIKTTFKLRRGYAERWKEVNPKLADGEPGFELDTFKLKIGDGKTLWNELPYVTGEGSISPDGTTLALNQNGNISLFGFDAAEPGMVPVKNQLGTLEWKKIEVPIATSSISGIMRLYNSIGENTDGTMTQKAITDELSEKVEVALNIGEEMLIFTQD